MRRACVQLFVIATRKLSTFVGLPSLATVDINLTLGAKSKAAFK